MFGLACSPSFLRWAVCHRVLKYLDLNENLVVKFFNVLYMNDSISDCDCSEKCFEFYLPMKIILKEGNFNLQKWISNCTEIMEKINSFKEQECDEKIFQLNNFHKVLGILWNFEIGELFFDLKNFVSESQISTVSVFFYDFLGIISPTIITLKILFQKNCMMKINWDDVLPEVITAEWQNILENLNVMNSLKLERHYLKKRLI